MGMKNNSIAAIYESIKWLTFLLAFMLFIAAGSFLSIYIPLDTDERIQGE